MCEERRQPFAQRKAEVLARSGDGVASITPLTPAEAALEASVYRPVLAAAPISPAKSFLEHKGDYDGSELLALLRRMPKGGVLHTHGISNGDFSLLVEALQRDGHFFVWQGDSSTLEGTVRAFASSKDAGPGWAAAGSLPREKLYGYLTLQAGLPSVEACWEEFGKIWERVLPVGSIAPFYYGRGGFFWSMLHSHMEAGIVYVEIKEPLFVPFTDYSGRALSDDEWMQQFSSTVLEFQKDNPGFVGARIVPTCLKAQTVEEVRADFRRAVELKRKFPDFVAGIDMAGPEDVLNPIELYAAMLEEETARAKRGGVDLPLILHAGETNVPHASQVVDAVVVGCERIGHGFALARHPALLERVRAAGISLECCPISNQVLGYFPDLATHAALGLMRAGVPLTLSPDDPGMWHYSDVSYDFAAVGKAWNLSLAELKALARNSLACSTLRGSRRERALQAWEAQWDEWVGRELRAAGLAEGAAARRGGPRGGGGGAAQSRGPGRTPAR